MHLTMAGFLVGAVLWQPGVLELVRDAPVDPPRPTMSQDEAKAMILHFLDHSTTARGCYWIRKSREVIADRRIHTVRANGYYRWGPWVVQPAERKVELHSLRGQVFGEIELTNDGYRIVNEEVVRFLRGRPK